jgi:hypothetical protein
MGCTAEVSSTPQGQGDVNGAELELNAEAALRQYVASLVERDEARLKAVVSSEILDRAAEYKGLTAFLEKQRGSLVKQYGDGPDLASRVSVGRAVRDGNDVTADIGIDGVAIQKPWHFTVADDGSLKVNVLPPGFARPRPPGTVAADWYLVQHTGWPNGGGCIDVKCPFPGNWATVCGYMTYQSNVSCNNTCGFWAHGSQFLLQGDEHYNLGDCDYNTWGVDVWVGISNGAAVGWCNDSC